MKPIWTIPLNPEEVNLRAQNSLCDHLGIIFTEVGPNFLTATMPVEQRTMQPMGILHGGASCALAETVGSAAANFCVDLSRKVCVGLEINVNHVRAVRSGTVRAVAKPLHLGKSTHVWDIQIFNDSQELVAISRLTMAVLDKK